MAGFELYLELDPLKKIDRECVGRSDSGGDKKPTSTKWSLRLRILVNKVRMDTKDPLPAKNPGRNLQVWTNGGLWPKAARCQTHSLIPLLAGLFDHHDAPAWSTERMDEDYQAAGRGSEG